MNYTRKIQLIGGKSHAVVIPKEFMEELKLKKGHPVSIKRGKNKTIIIQKIMYR